MNTSHYFWPNWCALLITCISLLLVSNGYAQIYKSVTQDGKVEYSDQPPTQASTTTSTIEPAVNQGFVSKPSAAEQTWQQPAQITGEQGPQHSKQQEQQIQCETAKREMEAAENTPWRRATVAERSTRIEAAQQAVRTKCPQHY